MESVSDMIRSRLTIYDLLERYHVPGKGGRTSCPIHCGTGANFSYNDFLYHCFVCGAKGNLMTLAQELLHTDYRGAVRILNRDFCLQLPLNRKRTLREKHAMNRKNRESFLIRNMEREEWELRRENRRILWLTEEAVRAVLDCEKPKTPAELSGVSEVYLAALDAKTKLEYWKDRNGWG